MSPNELPVFGKSIPNGRDDSGRKANEGSNGDKSTRSRKSALENAGACPGWLSAAIIVYVVLCVAIGGLLRKHESRPKQKGYGTRQHRAETDLDTLLLAVMMFEEEYGRLPKSLEELKRQEQSESGKSGEPFVEGSLCDPWGTPYHFSVEGRQIRVSSAGPDRKFGTSDDIEHTRKLPSIR